MPSPPRLGSVPAPDGEPAADLRDILDALPSLVAYVDEAGRNRYANRAAATWVGLTPGEMYGLTVRELLGDDGYAAVEAHVLGALAGETRVFERTVVRADGSIVHTLTEYLPQWRDGRPHGFVALVTDITRQVRAEAAHEAGVHRVEELLSLNRMAVDMSDTLLQELYAIGLHLERIRRIPGQDLDGAAPVFDSIETMMDRLRTTIKKLGDGAPATGGPASPDAE